MTQQTTLFTSQLFLRQALLGGGNFENGSMLWPKRQPSASLAVWQIQQDAPARPFSPPSQTSGSGGPQVACQSCPGGCSALPNVLSLCLCDVWCEKCFCAVSLHICWSGLWSWMPLLSSFGCANRQGGSKLVRMSNVTTLELVFFTAIERCSQQHFISHFYL